MFSGADWLPYLKIILLNLFQVLQLTGTGGKLATELIGGIFVNEIIAQATSAGKLFPDAQNSY